MLPEGTKSTCFEKEKPLKSFDFNGFFRVPDWIRTSGLQSRSLTLYPAELRVHILCAMPRIAYSLYHMPPDCQAFIRAPRGFYNSFVHFLINHAILKGKLVW